MTSPPTLYIVREEPTGGATVLSSQMLFRYDVFKIMTVLFALHRHFLLKNFLNLSLHLVYSVTVIICASFLLWQEQSYKVGPTTRCHSRESSYVGM